MKVLVLGATGKTGQFLVKQSLQQGHMVTAVVRTPSKLTIHHDNLKVVQADIFSADSLVEHFNEQNVVMSCLGFPISIFSQVTQYTESMKAIIASMRLAKVKRIIAMTSWYTQTESAQLTSWMVRWLLIPMIRTLLNNMYEMENYLTEECMDLDWTTVRPPELQNAPETDTHNITADSFRPLDKEMLTYGGYFVPDQDGNPIANAVTRGDVARFMLSQLNEDTWVKKSVAMVTV
ncbi:flavin reductase (NADPH)-like isoform X1 [Amblyraja radiata]|uniref:flavin reductase (NADPH)-like isoform X1 n=1 Tax=Amblyraja radiata TaxID=386614 RepID=UPI0014024108|nr:flavin reductase (NADPH)-like isoform X1 [Amblyraja radiata]